MRSGGKEGRCLGWDRGQGRMDRRRRRRRRRCGHHLEGFHRRQVDHHRRHCHRYYCYRYHPASNCSPNPRILHPQAQP